MIKGRERSNPKIDKTITPKLAVESNPLTDKIREPTPTTISVAPNNLNTIVKYPGNDV